MDIGSTYIKLLKELSENQPKNWVVNDQQQSSSWKLGCGRKIQFQNGNGPQSIHWCEKPLRRDGNRVILLKQNIWI